MRDIASLLQESNLKTLMATPPLDLCYDVLCDSETYQVGEGDEGTRGGERGRGKGTGGGGGNRRERREQEGEEGTGRGEGISSMANVCII